MKVKTPVAAVLAGTVVVLAFLVWMVGIREAALVAEAASRGQAEQVGEEHNVTGARLAALTPDPIKFPVPRTKWDRKPDFSGVYWAYVWLPYDPSAGLRGAANKALDLLDTLYRPEVLAARAKMNPEDSPGMHCWPESPANGGMHPTLNVQLVSTPGFLAVINEYGANYRIIPTDGRPHDRSAPRTFGGDSVGHWEGDTLVVDVTNFKVRNKFGIQYDDTWSDAMHVVERWTRPDARFFEFEAVIEDPKTLTEPWTAPKLRRGRMAYDIAQENFCVQDQIMQTINTEQIEYSERKGVRRPR